MGGFFVMKTLASWSSTERFTGGSMEDPTEGRGSCCWARGGDDREGEEEERWLEEECRSCI
jgi:hypothetical protein